MSEPNRISRKPGGTHTSGTVGLEASISYVVNRLNTATKKLMHEPAAVSIWFINAVDKKP